MSKLIILGGNTEERYVLGGSIGETDIIMNPSWCYRKLAAESNTAKVLSKRLNALIKELPEMKSIKGAYIHKKDSKLALKIPDISHMEWSLYDLKSIVDVTNTIRAYHKLHPISISIPECESERIFRDNNDNDEKLNNASHIESFYLEILESINNI